MLHKYINLVIEYNLSMKTLLRIRRLDQIGMVASIACAVHCAALPLVITILPLIGMEFLANPLMEIAMICLSVIIGAWSLVRSYTRHKNLAPLLVLLIGFSLIASGHFFLETAEAILVPLGGFAIAAGHYLNWKRNRVCEHA